MSTATEETHNDYAVEMRKTGSGWTMSHLVTGSRNVDRNGDCEMLVTGYGWARYCNKLCACLIDGKWLTY